LARDIESRQIIAWIRLGVPQLPCLMHRLRKLPAVLERGHEKAERAGEASENRLDAITGFSEFCESVEHGQAGARRRFIAKCEAAIFRGLHEAFIFELRDRERLLVRGDDVEAVLQRLLQQ